MGSGSSAHPQGGWRQLLHGRWFALMKSTEALDVQCCIVLCTHISTGRTTLALLTPLIVTCLLWFYPVTRPIKSVSYYSTLTSNTNPTKCQLREKYVEIVAIMVRSISFGRVVNPTQPTIYKWHLHLSPKQHTIPLLCMVCVMTSGHVWVVYTHKVLVSMILHY